MSINGRLGTLKRTRAVIRQAKILDTQGPYTGKQSAPVLCHLHEVEGYARSAKDGGSSHGQNNARQARRDH